MWEWVEDWHRDSYSGAPVDGSAWTSGGGSGRVYRGGSWSNTAWFGRLIGRFRSTPSYRSGFLGFRLAR